MSVNLKCVIPSDSHLPSHAPQSEIDSEKETLAELEKKVADTEKQLGEARRRAAGKGDAATPQLQAQILQMENRLQNVRALHHILPAFLLSFLRSCGRR